MSPNPQALTRPVDKAVKRTHSKTKIGDPKFRLHDIASRILLDPAFNTKEEQAKIDNGIYPNMTKCQKIPFMFGDKSKHVNGVPLRISKEHGSYSFQGLFSCGSVWSCPICASRIAQARCEEVATAFEIWQELGKENGRKHSQVMVSFTIPHYSDQAIKALRSSFMKTRVIMKDQKVLKKNPTFKPWQTLCQDYGIHGTLAAIETTFGYHGWHPHSHDILFLDRELSDDEIKDLKAYLTTAWIYACRRTKVKMTPDQEYAMFQRAVQVRKAPTAEEYISKFGLVDYEKHKDVLNPGWGASQELTKSHIKKSRGENGYTPWDFLRIIDQFPDDRSLYLRFGRLFREYSRAFFNTRQLFWSKGFANYLTEANKLYIIRP